jgi:hypothetical protein
MLFFNNEEICAPSRSGDKTCYIFKWVGQSFESCDECGKPYWNHLFRPAFGGSKGDYRIKKYSKRFKCWVWTPVYPITAEEREATKIKWEGYNARQGVYV